MSTSQVNGVGIYWEIAGHVGDPLVLVHGSWGDHQNWASVVPALARSFRVLTYDRRGHSRSERPAGQGSVRDDVADLAALLEELQHTPAHVVGNSFGASIVLRLAAARSELFRSLIVHGLDYPTNGFDRGPHTGGIETGTDYPLQSCALSCLT